jgi:hypothetical protein
MKILSSIAFTVFAVTAYSQAGDALQTFGWVYGLAQHENLK